MLSCTQPRLYTHSQWDKLTYVHTTYKIYLRRYIHITGELRLLKYTQPMTYVCLYTYTQRNMLKYTKPMSYVRMYTQVHAHTEYYACTYVRMYLNSISACSRTPLSDDDSSWIQWKIWSRSTDTCVMLPGDPPWDIVGMFIPENPNGEDMLLPTKGFIRQRWKILQTPSRQRQMKLMYVQLWILINPPPLHPPNLSNGYNFPAAIYKY